nr:DNA-binding protein [Micromonospora sp. DSM 115978]
AGRLLAVDDARTPVEELLARGLLAGLDEETVELPREVGLVLRRDAPAGVLHPAPPPSEGSHIGQVAADEAAAGAAEALVRHVTTVLEAWSLHPPTPLRTGGLGVRDFRATAKLLDLPESATAVVVEVAAAAGLVAVSAGADAQVVPTTAYDRWATETTSRRWAVLVDAWCDSHQLPGLVGE